MFTTIMVIDRTTQQLLRNTQKRRAWVIYQLLLKDKTLADVARAAGVERQTLYHVFERPYPKMERLVAEAVGLTPQKLFSERYDADGLPLRRKGLRNGGKSYRHGGKKHSAPSALRNTQAGGSV